MRLPERPRVVAVVLAAGLVVAAAANHEELRVALRGRSYRRYGNPAGLEPGQLGLLLPASPRPGGRQQREIQDLRLGTTRQ